MQFSGRQLMWVKQTELLLPQDNSPRFLVDEGMQSRKQKLEMYQQTNSLMHNKNSDHDY